MGRKLSVDVTGVKNPGQELHHFGFRYRWLRSGEPIAGATGASYFLSADDEGEAIAVRVTFWTKRGHRLTLTSESSDPISGPGNSEMSCAAEGSGEGDGDLVTAESKTSNTITTRDIGGRQENNGVVPKVEGSENRNIARFDTEPVSYHIDENTPAFQPIGAPVAPSDAATQTYTYSLKGAGNSYFGINSRSGQLLTGHPLDFESKNSYEVVVVAKRPGRTLEKEVDINVRNVDESGQATLSWNNPQVGVEIAATLADPDGGITATQWQWLRADSFGGTFNPISNATSASYTPGSSDSGKYLRAKATYTDAHGASKEAIKQTGRAVRAASADTSDPDFRIPSQNTGYRCDPNVVDTYCLSASRSTTPGSRIYYPTSATDADGDEVAYSLSGNSDLTDHFQIDRFSGQLSTKKRVDQYPVSGSHEFAGTITATEPSGGSDSITVNIDLTGGQGRPVVIGPRTIRYPENGTWRVGTYSSTVTKNAGDSNALSTNGWLIGVQPGGGDGDFFDIDDAGILRFANPPDFENPRDEGRDNQYNFSLHVYDSNPPHQDTNRTTFYSVTVIVTDSEDEFDVHGPASVDFAENGTGPVASFSAPSGVGTIGWSLGGDDQGKFSIDANGVLRFRSPPDFEAEASADGNNEYVLNITVRDQSESRTRTGFTVNVTDVNEPPSFDDGPSTSRTVEEDAADGDDVGDPVSASDPDNDSLTYTLSGADAGSFAIDSSNGQISTATNWNSASKSRFEVTVSVTDNFPNSNVDDTITVTINVGEVNDRPEFGATATSNPSVAENSPGGTVIETYNVTDPENDPITYSLGGADKDSFSINSRGELLTKAPLDYEDKSRYQVQIRATDGLGREGQSDPTIDDMITVGITVTDVNEPSQLPSGQIILTVDENTASGQPIGNPIAATDPENDPPTYSLDPAGDLIFDIDSASGQLSTQAALNFEDQRSYEIDFSVTDGKAPDGTNDPAIDDTITVTISVRDMNEPPEFTTGSITREIAENTPAGRNIGAPILADDPERDPLTYSLDPAADLVFDISATSGQLSTQAALDFEDQSSYVVSISVTDKKDEYGNSDSAIDDTVSVTIAITDVYERPQFPGTATTRSVVETDQANVTIGAPVSASNPENRVLEYTLGGASATLFDIDAASGQLLTKNELDYETPPNRYTVAVSVNDGIAADGTTDDAADDSITVTINVTDTNAPPAFTENSPTRSVKENTPAGINIGDPIAATDPDRDALTYLLRGTDAASFEVDPENGQIKTKAALDYESDTSYSVIVGVHDGKDVDGNSDSTEDAHVTVTIEVVDIATPLTPAIPTVTPDVSQTLSVSWTAPGPTDPPVTGYNLRYREKTTPMPQWTGSTDNADVAFDQNSATIGGLGHDTLYEVQLQAYNSEPELSNWSESGDGRTNKLQLTTRFGQVSYSVNEGDDISITVSLAPDANRAVQVPISVTAVSAESEDYAVSGLTNDALNFQDGENQMTFVVTSNQDDDRNNEVISLGFGQLPAGVAGGTPATARVTIVDDERSSGGGGGGSRNRRASGLPVISGYPEVGRQLTVSTAEISDPDGMSDAVFAYSWIRELDGAITVIPGQTGSSLTLVESDVDHTIRVRVSFHDDRGFSESLTSEAVGPVLAPFGRRPSENTPSQADPDAFSTARSPVIRVLANRYVEGPGNDNLKHNIPNLEISWSGVVRTADFLTHYDITGGLERWGYPVSEVMVLEPGALTQFYQRGAVDFHNVGQGWVIERRLTWEYVGGIHAPGGDQGTEPFLTNPHVGEPAGPWGHKVSNYSVDGVVTHFADTHNRLGGTLAFGLPLTDARINFLVPGLLHAPGTTPGFVRQFYQAAIFELHPYPNNPVMLTLLGDILRDILVPEHARHAPFNAVPELVIGQVYPLYYVNDAVG